MKTGSLVLKQNRFARFVSERRHLIIEIISALLILLFVYAALSKLLNYQNFRGQISRSPLIKDYTTIIAWAIPSIELLISLLLFIPRTRLIGLISSFLLMSIFTLYIGYMLVFVPNLPCSCGGVLQNMTWTQHLIFNIFFTAFSFLGLVQSRRK